MPSVKSCVLGLVAQSIPSRPVVQEDSFSFVTLRVITVLRRLIVKEVSFSGGFCGTGFRWCKFPSELLVLFFSFFPLPFLFLSSFCPNVHKNLAEVVLPSQGCMDDFFITLYVCLLEDFCVSFQEPIHILLGVVILSFHKFIEFSQCNLVLVHFFSLSLPLKACLLDD